MSNNAISIYLNDHLAIMSAESELIQRTARANPSTPLSECLWEIFTELRQQKDAVTAAIDRRGGQVSLIKQNAAWLLEKLGRLKFNGTVASYADLSRVVEIEAMIAAGEARLTMWKVLLESTSEIGYTRSLYEAFHDNTKQGLKALRHHHGEAASIAFPQPESTEETAASSENEAQSEETDGQAAEST